MPNENLQPIEVKPRVLIAVDEQHEVKPLKPHKVIVWNDNEHSDIFVVEVLMKVCGKNEQEAIKLTAEIHTKGKAVVFVTHKEHAEFKRDQITTFRDEYAIQAGAPNIALNVTLESE